MKICGLYRLFMLILLLTSIILISCEVKTDEDPAYVESINAWKKIRYEALTNEDGYLVLAGLYWLNPGENTYGSDPSNDIVFPGKAPAVTGAFFLEGDSVYTIINPGVEILNNGSRVDSLELMDDSKGKPTSLVFGTLKWYVIKRGDKYGIRLKDTEHPVRKNFTGVDYFDLSKIWRVEATFIPSDKQNTISIQNIIGTTNAQPSAGKLSFEIDGKNYTLDVLDGGEDKFFVIFGDMTNGDSTYGAGRYMYTEKPGKDNKVVLDFNKAYNPPCAFTEFATCPLPPPQNILDIRVTAGEKVYEDGPHAKP